MAESFSPDWKRSSPATGLRIAEAATGGVQETEDEEEEEEDDGRKVLVNKPSEQATTDSAKDIHSQKERTSVPLFQLLLAATCSLPVAVVAFPLAVTGGFVGSFSGLWKGGAGEVFPSAVYGFLACGLYPFYLSGILHAMHKRRHIKQQ